MKYLILLTLLLTGCCNQAFTKASKDFATTIGAEYLEYRPEAEGIQILIDQTLQDECVEYTEGQLLYEQLGVPYLEALSTDETLTEFDLRIRTRYLDDYKVAAYGR